MQSVKVKDGQTLFDLSIQCLGIADRVFDIALLNGLSITDRLVSGQEILIPEVAFAELKIVDFFRHPWFPACGDPDDFELLGGINFMQIGTNFKVS
jgi:hypothetical protein